MKINKYLIAFVLAVTLLGCGKHQPRQFVILPDVSGSIDRESLQQAFKAIDQIACHLQRGDTLTIIPILGDAEAEASGKIMRFEVPATRQAYDADLPKFRAKLETSFRKMEANAIFHPGTKTDILGTIELAQQELKIDARHLRRLIVILSDFIQEDREFDFRVDRRLSDPIIATKLSTLLANQRRSDFRGISVYLGLLRSNSFVQLDRNRRAAIQAFWISYFKYSNGKPSFAVDGSGLLQNYELKGDL